MTVVATPSIFDVFNARQLTPQQVANTFVPPPHFDNLVKPTHTLVMGPRGSGKTTLLKMLHPAALEAWSHPEASKYRSAINYTGVFVATDINWSEQVRSLGDGRLDADSQRMFAKAAFTTQILQALLTSMLYRLNPKKGEGLVSHRRVKMDEVSEKAIATEIISCWHIDRTVPTLEGIYYALSRRLSQIRVLASQEAYRDVAARTARIADIKFLHLDFQTAASVAVDVFNTKAKETGARWALLFDELELAPEWIRAMLIRYLRSVDETFLFKITLSPYSVDVKKEMDGIDSPAARQDFEPIRLWYPNKETGYPFCRKLLDGMLASKGLESATPDELFGPSAFSTTREEASKKNNAYRPDSILGRQFRSLANIDATFADYLNRKHIDLDRLGQLVGSRRASELRKVRSVVVLRNYFRAFPDQEQSSSAKLQYRRSRKVPSVYGGGDSLFAMVEGNPRWFIGIVGELINRAAKFPVPASQQVHEVIHAASVFRAMLRTIPYKSSSSSSRGLLSLLDPIGDYFSNAAIDMPFEPDPPCSFIVDAHTEPEQLKALGMALNAGAIVFAPDEDDLGIVDNPKGKRFRLSFILAPQYCIPLVLGRSISLSEVLRRSAGSQSTSSPTLFDLIEEESDAT
jgi:energy-coupling factor transporter ATP-binding protein EcfA2